MHTPTPWYVTADGHVAHEGNRHQLAGRICTMTDPGHPSSKADAALIVRAVNCHAELVAALEATNDQAQHDENCPWWNVPAADLQHESERRAADAKCNCFVLTVRAALAKAQPTTEAK